MLSLYRFERCITLICMTKNDSVLRASERTGASICPAVCAVQLPHSAQTLEQRTFLG